MDFAKYGAMVTSLLTAVIAVAIVSVLLSNGSATAAAIQSFFSGLSYVMAKAVQPLGAGVDARGLATGGSATAVGAGGGVALSSSAISGIGSLASQGASYVGSAVNDFTAADAIAGAVA
jgi:hypothetical protein